MNRIVNFFNSIWEDDTKVTKDELYTKLGYQTKEAFEFDLNQAMIQIPSLIVSNKGVHIGNRMEVLRKTNSIKKQIKKLHEQLFLYQYNYKNFKNHEKV